MTHAQNHEILFWKIFKNIVLFNKIFSNFNNRLYGYDDITNDVILLYFKFNNPIEIIIDKIKCNNNNNYNNFNIIKSNNDFEFIISKVSKNKLFYNKLFTYYSNTSTTSTTPIIESFKIYTDKEKWIKYMLVLSNLIALDEYIKIFKIEKETIQKCLIELQILDRNLTRFKDIKTYYYLNENNYLPTHSINHNHNLIDINSLDPISYKFKFKRLINRYNILLNEFNKNINKDNDIFYHQNNNNSHKKLKNLKIELNQTNNHNSNPIIKEHLESSIINILESNNNNNNNNTTLKDIIHKYYKSIYLIYKLHNNNNNSNNSNDKFKKPILYYVYFKKDLNLIINKINILSNGTKTIFNYIHPLFQSTYNNNNNNNNNNEERIEFISTIFKMNMNNDNEIFKLLCKLIISCNEIELIDHFFKLINDTNQVIKIIDSSIHLIKSIKLLDYYFENYKNQIELFKEGNDIWNELTKHSKGRGDLDESLIENYENLMNSINMKIKLDLNIQYSINLSSRYNNNCIEIIHRAFQKPSIYTIIPSRKKRSFIDNIINNANK